MAIKKQRKPKFPLLLKDGAEVRSIDELREHFDIDKMVAYLADGKLLAWLKDRGLEEADDVAGLSVDDKLLKQKLCEIFQVPHEEESGIDPDELIFRNERLTRLKQYTDNSALLDMIDVTAFDQDDYGELVDDEDTILLCQNEFRINKKRKNKKYIGVGDVTAIIDSKEVIDFEALGITFENIKFDDAYEQVLNAAKAEKASGNPKTWTKAERKPLMKKKEVSLEASYSYNFTAQVYVRTKEEGGGQTTFFQGRCYQFFFGSAGVITGRIGLPGRTKMVMPGDTIEMTVELITPTPIAIEKGIHFSIREGRNIVGDGRITKTVETNSNNKRLKFEMPMRKVVEKYNNEAYENPSSCYCSKFKAQACGRYNRFYTGQRCQFAFSSAVVITGRIGLIGRTESEMVMPGDNIEMIVELITPIAIKKGLHFDIREGGNIVGDGRVTEIDNAYEQVLNKNNAKTAEANSNILTSLLDFLST